MQAAIVNIDAEVIVVDNNSEDDSCQMVKALFPKVVLIENNENFGFSKGNNIGVSQAKGEFICILNPDTVVAEDTFERLLDYAQNKDKLGAIGCRLIDGTGNYLPESKRNTPLVKVAFKKLMGNSKHYYANHIEEKGEGEKDILVGAFMFLEKDVYNKVNGFDEDYFMYGEDIDLSYKILKAGYKNYYFGSTSIIHFKGESTLKDKNYARRFYGAMQIFYRKHFKRNILFDTLVWSGIHLAYLLRRVKKQKDKKVNRYVLVSNNQHKKLQSVLSEKIVIDSELKNFEVNDEIILDANYLSYKEIVAILNQAPKDKNITFKILPNNSNFILGSNDAISRGKVITF